MAYRPLCALRLFQSRLERAEDGNVYYGLKEAFSDGTSGIRLSP